MEPTFNQIFVTDKMVEVSSSRHCYYRNPDGDNIGGAANARLI